MTTEAEELKPYTILFEVNGHVATVTLEAHCEQCAFFGALSGLSNKIKDKPYPMARALGFFNGKLENRWPELEDVMLEAAKEHGSPPVHVAPLPAGSVEN